MKAPQTQSTTPIEAKGPIKFERPLTNREYLVRMIAECRKRIRETMKEKQKNLFAHEMFCNEVKSRNYIK